MEVVASSGNEEMALIAAAAAGARPLLSSAARRAAAPLSYAAYSTAGPAAGDIEDSPLPRRSPLAQFQERRALAVTDITATVTPSPKLAPSAFLVSWSGQIISARIQRFLMASVLFAAGMVREKDGIRAQTRQAGEDRGHEGRFGPPCAARA